MTDVAQQITQLIQSHLDETPEGKIPLICILGPTAVGKTKLSIGLAQEFDGEIISADSRQVYTYMDIGTDKITEEEMQGVSHHMLDVVDPDEEFSVYDFKTRAEALIPEIHGRGHIPFIVGGTMLYTDALTKGFDFDAVKPNEELRQELQAFLDQNGKEALHERLAALDQEAAKKIHPNNAPYVLRALEKAIEGPPLEKPKKPEHNYHVLKIGLMRPREEIYDRINQRVEQQLKDGKLEAEAKELIEKYGTTPRSITGLGYRQFIPYFSKKTKEDGTPYTLEDVKKQLQQETRNFAKRQLSWWRKDDEIHWFDV